MRARDATYWDIQPVAGVLAATVLPTRLGRWLEAEPVARGRHLFHHGARCAVRALQCGVVRVVEADAQVVAVALWLPCAATTQGDVLVEEAGFAQRLHRLGAGCEQSYDRMPHLRLGGLGVLPRWRRQGIAGGLLAEQHGVGVPWVRCLLAADDVMAALALRCGFRLDGEGQSMSSGTGAPVLQPMVRMPASTGIHVRALNSGARRYGSDAVHQKGRAVHQAGGLSTMPGESA